MASLATSQDAFVLIGDSITEGAWTPQGFATRLAAAFVRRLDILNRGFGGYTSRQLLPIAQRLFQAESSPLLPKVAIVSIFLGANDAVIFGEQVVPLEEYCLNISAIATLCPPSTPTLLITPPIPDGPAWAATKGADLAPNRTEANTALYAEGVREVGRALVDKGLKVETIDLWKAMDLYRQVKGQSLSDLLTDGLHLSELGYKLLSDLILLHLGRMQLLPGGGA